MWDAEHLTQHWRAHFPWPPIAHTLRSRCPDRWFRIHTLPQSKRYPENEPEYCEIVRRHNTLLDDLLGSGGEAVLVTSAASLMPEPAAAAEADDATRDARFWLTIPMHEHDDFDVPTYWHLFHRPLRWRAGMLDALLRRVAQWQTVNVMILSTAVPHLYHPYDGGADVLVEAEVRRDELRAKYASWLSPRPDGT
jgi:hypothetical protein